MEQALYCCESLRDHLNHACQTHPDPWDCPDAVIVRQDGMIGLPIRDGGRSFVEILACPWCGIKFEWWAQMTRRTNI